MFIRSANETTVCVTSKLSHNVTLWISLRFVIIPTIDSVFLKRVVVGFFSYHNRRHLQRVNIVGQILNPGVHVSLTNAVVTLDRRISGSYDFFAIGPRCDRSAMFATVAYRDRSLHVFALSRTIGEYRRQEPS